MAEKKMPWMLDNENGEGTTTSQNKWWWIGGIGLLVLTILVVMVIVAYTGPTEPVSTPVDEEEKKEEKPAEEKEEVEAAPGFTLETADVVKSRSDGFYLRGEAFGSSGPGEVWFRVTEPGGGTKNSSSRTYPDNLPGEWDMLYSTQEPGKYKIEVRFQPDDGREMIKGMEEESITFDFSP